MASTNNSFITRIQDILGIKKTSQKSFRSLDSSKNKQSRLDFDNGGWISSDVATSSYLNFDLKTFQQSEYQDNPIFLANQRLIETKVFEKNTFIKSLQPRINQKLENKIIELGYTKKLQQQAFNILYAGCGACLLLFVDEKKGDEIVKKLRLIPFVKNNRKLVDITYNFLGDITSITLELDNYERQVLDLANTDYYILYNIKIEDRNNYLSNLTLASPFIATETELLKRDLDFARNGFNSIPLITPKIDKIGVDGASDLTLTVGGQIYNYSDFIQGGFRNIKKQVQNELKNSDIPIFPFDVNVNKITSDNNSNQTNITRKYLHECIQIACFSNGSVTGRDGTSNRAVSEQDRDNFEENTIRIFQKKFEDVVNDWLLPLIIPKNYQDFKYQFYREVTDESLKLREQAQKSYELLVNPANTNLLANVGLRLNKEQVKNIFKQAHNIDLDELETETNLKSFSFTDSIKTDIDLSKLKYLEFEDIISKFTYKKIKNLLKQKLTAQYNNFIKKEGLKINSNNFSTFERYLSQDEFKNLLQEYVQIISQEYRKKINDNYKDNINLAVAKIQDIVKLTYEGGIIDRVNPTTQQLEIRDYLGFDNTQRSRIENKESLTKEQIESYIKLDLASFENNLFLPLFKEVYEEIAIEDGANWIGTIAKNDRLVRNWHLNNSNTAFKIGSGIMQDSTNRFFYLEPNCRCNQVYGTKEQLKKAGFKIIE